MIAQGRNARLLRGALIGHLKGSYITSLQGSLMHSNTDDAFSLVAQELL